MKKLLIVCFLLPTCFFGFSQDTLQMSSGEQVIAVVNNVSTTEIEYRKFDNPTGPLYVRNKNEVKSIHYKNGTSDVFETKASSQPKTADDDDYYGAAASSGAASTTITMSDVVSANQLVFYGLDFSNFKLVEGKRKSEATKIRDLQFAAWNTYFEKEVPEKTMARWLKKVNVTYSTDVVAKINSQVDPNKIVIDYLDLQDLKTAIKKTVSSYAAIDTRTSGIGFVICMDYFSKNRNETSAYFTFFDISTHAIIATELIRVNEAKGGGLTNYWGVGLVAAMKDYIDYRYKRY